MVFMEEDVGRKEYQMPEQAFSSEEDALRAAAKKTNLRSQLLSFCQVGRLSWALGWVFRRVDCLTTSGCFNLWHVGRVLVQDCCCCCRR